MHSPSQNFSCLHPCRYLYFYVLVSFHVAGEADRYWQSDGGDFPSHLSARLLRKRRREISSSCKQLVLTEAHSCCKIKLITQHWGGTNKPQGSPLSRFWEILYSVCMCDRCACVCVPACLPVSFIHTHLSMLYMRRHNHFLVFCSSVCDVYLGLLCSPDISCLMHIQVHNDSCGIAEPLYTPAAANNTYSLRSTVPKSVGGLSKKCAHVVPCVNETERMNLPEM